MNDSEVASYMERQQLDAMNMYAQPSGSKSPAIVPAGAFGAVQQRPNACLGLWGKLFGHRYQQFVAYNEHDRGVGGKGFRMSGEELRELFTLRTVHSVTVCCTRCGRKP